VPEVRAEASKKRPAVSGGQKEEGGPNVPARGRPDPDTERPKISGDAQPAAIFGVGQIVSMVEPVLTERMAVGDSTVTDASHRAVEIVERCDFEGVSGRPSAEDLFPLVYDEMRRIAGRIMGRESPGHTLQPTALVHEAYLKLVDQTRANWKGRTHFLAVGAQVMRRLLINHARDRAAVKRGRSWERVALTSALARPGRDLVDLDLLIALNRAVERLAGLDERQAAVVTLRFFGGLEIEEIAQVLGVSKRTVDYDWRYARAWLVRELAGVEKP